MQVGPFLRRAQPFLMGCQLVVHISIRTIRIKCPVLGVCHAPGI